MSRTALVRRCLAGVAQQSTGSSLMRCTAMHSASLRSSVATSAHHVRSLCTLTVTPSTAASLSPFLSLFPTGPSPSAAPTAVPFLVELVCPPDSSYLSPQPVPLECMNRNKRRIGKANHGARPCNSVGRKQRTLNNKAGWRQLGLRPGQSRPALKGAGTPAVYAETNQ